MNVAVPTTVDPALRAFLGHYGIDPAVPPCRRLARNFSHKTNYCVIHLPS